jgi:microcystin-dependent protein
MAQPYIGEIKMFAGNFAPAGWAYCNGQLMPISENDALFTLIGTTYGGDGQETFGLPDLQGRVPVHMGQGISQTYQIGEKAGVETVTVGVPQMPQHNHALLAASGAGTSANVEQKVMAASPSVQLYTQDVASVSLAAAAALGSGGSQPHENLMPYLTISFIISLYGVFPTQT